jgi:hypothetical protein
VKSLRNWAASNRYRAIWEPELRRSDLADEGTERPSDGAAGLAGFAERVGVRAAEAVVAGGSALRRTRENVRGIIGGSVTNEEAATARPDEEPV